MSSDTAPVSQHRSAVGVARAEDDFIKADTITAAQKCVDMMYDVMMCFLPAKDKGEKKLFGFAFTPLMREDGTTLSDEVHELYVYKVRRG